MLHSTDVMPGGHKIYIKQTRQGRGKESGDVPVSRRYGTSESQMTAEEKRNVRRLKDNYSEQRFLMTI